MAEVRVCIAKPTLGCPNLEETFESRLGAGMLHRVKWNGGNPICVDCDVSATYTETRWCT